MSIFPSEYVQHILDETGYLKTQTQGLSKKEFMRNETLKRAFVRSLEIIGEATKKIPSDFKQKHTHIDCRAVAGMRDKLIHNYFGIDYDILWDAVLNKIPVLHQELEQIMERETRK